VLGDRGAGQPARIEGNRVEQIDLDVPCLFGAIAIADQRNRGPAARRQNPLKSNDRLACGRWGVGVEPDRACP